MVKSPNPAHGKHVYDFLSSVTAVSSHDVWAIGASATEPPARRSSSTGMVGWTIVDSPNPGLPGSEDFLSGISASSASQVWAVGSWITGSDGSGEPFVLQWDGASWQEVESPKPPLDNTASLQDVVATSPTDAWAVGFDRPNGEKTLVEHWDGAAWTRVHSPNPTRDSGLSAVDAVSGLRRGRPVRASR